MNHKKQGKPETHRMKKSRWVGGQLETEILLFESLESALLEIKFLVGYHVKIYNELNELIHSQHIGNEHHHHHNYA